MNPVDTILNYIFRIPRPSGMCRQCGRPYFDTKSRWAKNRLCVNCYQMVEVITDQVISILDVEIHRIHTTDVGTYTKLIGIRNRVDKIRVDPFGEHRFEKEVIP